MWTYPDGERTAYWDGVIKANAFIPSSSSLSVPVGTIVMYGAATAPADWLLCDGASLLRAGTYADLFAVIGTTFGAADGTHFNVPDFRGIFPRGAGTSAKLTNANGVAFAGVLGTYQNDKMQGHYHNFYYSGGARGTVGPDNLCDVVNVGTGSTTNTRVKEALTDATNGTPRTGTETNPANLSVNFIIKY